MRKPAQDKYLLFNKLQDAIRTVSKARTSNLKTVAAAAAWCARHAANGFVYEAGVEAEAANRIMNACTVELD